MVVWWWAWWCAFAVGVKCWPTRVGCGCMLHLGVWWPMSFWQVGSLTWCVVVGVVVGCAGCFVLCVGRCLLCGVCCVLFGVCCLLCVVC